MEKAAFKWKDYFCNADRYLDCLGCATKQYIKVLPKKASKEIPRTENQLKEMGTIRVEFASEMSDFDRYMDLCHDVRARSWKRAEKDAAFSKEARRMVGEQGWLRCCFPYVDDIPVVV